MMESIRSAGTFAALDGDAGALDGNGGAFNGLTLVGDLPEYKSVCTAIFIK